MFVINGLTKVCIENKGLFSALCLIRSIIPFN